MRRKGEGEKSEAPAPKHLRLELCSKIIGTLFTTARDGLHGTKIKTSRWS